MGLADCDPKLSLVKSSDHPPPLVYPRRLRSDAVAGLSSLHRYATPSHATRTRIFTATCITFWVWIRCKNVNLSIYEVSSAFRAL